jgi:hypothetical protein
MAQDLGLSADAVIADEDSLCGVFNPRDYAKAMRYLHARVDDKVRAFLTPKSYDSHTISGLLAAGAEPVSLGASPPVMVEATAADAQRQRPSRPSPSSARRRLSPPCPTARHPLPASPTCLRSVSPG